MQDQAKLLPSAQNQSKESTPSIFDCFRLSSFGDCLIFFLGVFLSFLTGVANAAFGLVTGLALTAFDARNTEQERNDMAFNATISYIMIGLCIFFGTIGSRTCLRINAQRQGHKFRKAYLKALLNQEISSFDKVNPTEFSSQFENECKAIGEGLDSSLEKIVWYLGGMICSLVISFSRSWQIALMMFVAAPFMWLAIHLFGTTIYKGFVVRASSYGEAGAIAEEALTNIKTVVSLGGEKAEVERYEKALSKAQPALAKSGFYQGIAFGSTQLIFSGIMAVILYIGSLFMENDTINPTTGKAYVLVDIFTPLNAILLMFSQLPAIGPCMKGLIGAKINARKILDVVEKAKIDNVSSSGKIDNFLGAITFKNVSFAYPTNPNQHILQNVSFQIKANTKVALVGKSGSGKSTIIQLLQKFYEPTSGTIELDGHDSITLDAFWVRKNIAYVGQEPVLFSMTIRDNLLLGKEDATEDELIQALKKANAYEFVMGLEKKLDTFIGGASTQLSGGQKQRIAIARAILRDAKVLLLDEATSALDRMSEIEIQETINLLLQDRTIIIVTHRLTSIKDADQIIMLDKGKVEEKGTFEALMNLKGNFCELNSLQKDENKEKSKENSDEKEESETEMEGEETAFLQKKKSNPSSRRKSLKQQVPEEEKKNFTFSDVKRIWGLAKSEKQYFILGAIGSLGVAIALPLIQVFLAGSLASLVDVFNPDFRRDIEIKCILLIFSGILALLFFIVEFGLFTKASEKLTQELRVSIFYKFLRMHIGWHDFPQNSAGSLTGALEVEVTSVGQAAGMSLGLSIQILFTNFVIILIGLALCWQIGAICALVVPLLLYLGLKLSSNKAKGEGESAQILSNSEVLISETINNMKTVTSLNAQERFLTIYDTILHNYHEKSLKNKIKNGFLEGGLYLVLFLDLAVTYNLGVQLFTTLGVSPFKIAFTVFGISITAMSSTQLFELLPDVGRATHSIQMLFDYLDMKSEIDIEDKRAGYKGKIEGNIEFKNVKFSYPTRRVRVLDGLSFKIDANKHIGITGQSGCGKSTILQLLLRLYDVDAGDILIEGVNIKDYNLQYLRRNIGIVSQEPVLFYGSIEDNLKYANAQITATEMREAAKKANALNFIEDSEGGFQRTVGAKGGQLSGGQKQRIAIARALLRSPAVLLLDEATSALDAESEHVVQEALTKISQEMTSITVAHRLSTLKDLDEILVFKEGMIVERGKYDQLLNKCGYFYQLKEASSTF